MKIDAGCWMLDAGKRLLSSIQHPASSIQHLFLRRNRHVKYHQARITTQQRRSVGNIDE
jgi:hypothetical protein